MQDRVADVLAQRAALDRGAGVGVVISLALHAILGALTIYFALHAPAPRPVSMVNIQFAKLPAMTKESAAPKKAAAPPAPKIEEPKPVIEEPKPEPPKTEPPPKPAKNTVPFSPFGQSTKKGSETAPPPTPKPPTPAQPGGTGAQGAAPDVPVGGSGITGLEGGDFPYTLYLEGMQRKIGVNWFRPTVPPGTEVVVYYRIQRDGKITDVAVVKSSGNSTFDRAARSAVVSSAPLNKLPTAFTGVYLGVHLTFR